VIWSRTLALTVATLALVVAGTGCGSDADTGDSHEAQALVDSAFAGTQAVKSGDLELEIKADVEGIDSLHGPLTLQLRGPFESNGKGKLPSLDWDVGFEGGGQKLSGGVVVTPDNAYLKFQGNSYELGTDTYARLTRRLALKHSDQPLTPRQFGVNPNTWLKDPKVEEGEQIGGDDTRKITGSVEVDKVVKDFAGVLKSPALRKKLAQEGAAGANVPEPSAKDLKELDDAIEDVNVEMNVDKNDVLRRFFTEVKFNAKGKENGKDLKGTVSFLYVLHKVGGNPTITAPSDARPLSELLGGLGLGALGGGLGGNHN
jgi:hypothetical protein